MLRFTPRLKRKISPETWYIKLQNSLISLFFFFPDVRAVGNLVWHGVGRHSNAADLLSAVKATILNLVTTKTFLTISCKTVRREGVNY